ncbi:hypothetical protein [Micromonospora sp. NPDC093244]|uniref:hypothetical protein n=1 Tax=Micromonospora sp. NPDC093244 TaxID=3155071 RepID=UPI00342896D7
MSRSTPPDPTGGAGRGEPDSAGDVPVPGVVLATSEVLATGMPATAAPVLPGWSRPAGPAVPFGGTFGGADTDGAAGTFGAGGSAGGGQLGCAGAQPDVGPLFPHPPGAGTAPVSDG